MRRLWILAGFAVAAALTIYGVYFYQHRFVRTNSDLVRLLPPGDLTLVYADLGQLREAHLLGILTNIKFAPDKEYAEFVGDTDFDYKRDLNAIAIGADAAETFLVGRGRFDWEKLKHFAVAHGGVCGEAGCRLAASSPGRWVNFIRVQADVLGVAISRNPAAADNLQPPGRRIQEDIPNAPVWAKLSHGLLSNPMSLPIPMRIFAISLQNAGTVSVWAGPDRVHMKADFTNGATADTARRQLEIQTGLLKAALKGGNAQTEKGSIAGLLLGGAFQVVGTDLEGAWPIQPELLKALQ